MKPTTFLKGKLAVDDVIWATDGLIEALALLPRGTRARIFSKISCCREEFSIQFESLTRGELNLFLKGCRDGGIAVSEISSQKTSVLAGHFVEDSLQSSVFDHNVPVLALTVTETCEVTVPGAMHELTRSLHGQGLCGWTILEFQIGSQAGLAWFGLTVVFSVGEHQDGAHAAAEAGKLVGSRLNVVPQLHSGQTARRILARIEPGSRAWHRPKLPACLGNIADFFPL
ncbi:hypothetical protein [Deinococcus humi]|uniref:Uncharacterized protein n=1 Tax=Deinococcus humi TaxID=662880 RepID=A0A7W8K1N1_9DEIO|nr:hypothetical protein [Deinococcus humi]MBB5365928.1 hypothetical protein [Deinococcus humi]GGO40415.1 hypothetical protein GCM10008949_49870 [Deinococcus humi]